MSRPALLPLEANSYGQRSLIDLLLFQRLRFLLSLLVLLLLRLRLRLRLLLFLHFHHLLLVLHLLRIIRLLLVFASWRALAISVSPSLLERGINSFTILQRRFCKFSSPNINVQARGIILRLGSSLSTSLLQWSHWALQSLVQDSSKASPSCYELW